jgi:hypothetical protein
MKSISESLGCPECDMEEKDIESSVPKKKKKKIRGFMIIPISEALMEQDEESPDEDME